MNSKKQPTSETEIEVADIPKSSLRPKTAGSNKTAKAKHLSSDEYSEESLMMKLRGEKLTNILKQPTYDTESKLSSESKESVVKRPPVTWNVMEKHAPKENELDIVSLV